MANSTDTLKRIMDILNLKEEIKLAQETLENGTVIEADEFVAGAEVFIVTEDDERVALPVGEYAMADGKILQVTEEGIISGIADAEAQPEPEAPAEEAELEEEAPEDAEAPAEQLNYVTKEELAQVVDEIKMMVEQIVKEMAEEVAEEKIEEKTEMSKVAKPARKPMRHKPEAKTAKPLDLGKADKAGTTFDRVMAKIAK